MADRYSVQPAHGTIDSYKNWVSAEPAEIELPERERRTVQADNQPTPARLLIVMLITWGVVGVVAWMALRTMWDAAWSALLSLLIVAVLAFLSQIIFNGDFLGWRQIVNDRKIDIKRMMYEDRERIRRHKTARMAIEAEKDVQLARIEIDATAAQNQALAVKNRQLHAQLAAPRPQIAANTDTFVAPAAAAPGTDEHTTASEALAWVRETLYHQHTGRLDMKAVATDGRIKCTVIGGKRDAGRRAQREWLQHMRVIKYDDNARGYYLDIRTFPTMHDLPTTGG